MLERLAIWYLQRQLKKCKIDVLEFVIRSDGWTYAKRNRIKEKAVKETLSLIK